MFGSVAITDVHVMIREDADIRNRQQCQESEWNYDDEDSGEHERHEEPEVPAWTLLRDRGSHCELDDAAADSIKLVAVLTAYDDLLCGCVNTL